MAVVVGVHGIEQQQFGRRQLVEKWTTGFQDGLEIAFGRDFQAPSFDIAFYGDLFLTSTDQGIRVNESGVNSDAPIKGAEAARALDDSVPVDPRELEFLEAAAAAAEQGRPWVEPTSEANASRYRPVSGTGGGGRLWSMM